MADKNGVPMKCPVCSAEPDNYYGRLVWPGDDMLCINHPPKKPVKLVPVK